MFRYWPTLVLFCGLAYADDIRVEVPAEPFECGHARTCLFDDTARTLICITQRGELLVWKDKSDRPVVTTLEDKPGGGIFDRGPMSGALVSGNHLVLFYYDGRVQLWNIETGMKVRDIECDRKDLGTAKLSPDGQLVGVLSYGRERDPSAILFWNTRDWTTAGRIESDERINDFCFAADGKQVLTCVGHPTDQKKLGYTGIMSWNLETMEETERIEYGSGFPIRIEASPDGRCVAVGGGDAVPVGNNARSLSGHLRVYDWTDKDTVKESELYTLPSDYVRTVRFSPDSKFLYSGAESKLRAFRTRDWESEWESTIGNGNNPHQITVSPNGKDILVPVSQSLQIIDAKDGTIRGTKLKFRL